MSLWRVDYTEEAENDLSDIYSYISNSLLAPDNADGQVERIMQAVDELDHMPLRYETYPDEPWHSMGMRQMTVDNYSVLYYPHEESQVVGIIRIMYSPSDKSSRIRNKR